MSQNVGLVAEAPVHLIVSIAVMLSDSLVEVVASDPCTRGGSWPSAKLARFAIGLVDVSRSNVATVRAGEPLVMLTAAVPAGLPLTLVAASGAVVGLPLRLNVRPAVPAPEPTVSVPMVSTSPGL